MLEEEADTGVQDATGVAEAMVVEAQVVVIQAFPEPAVAAEQEATRVGPEVLVLQVTVCPPDELALQELDPTMAFMVSLAMV